jgi:dTDP-4-dehydrorhamnose 3,5-epimerase
MDLALDIRKGSPTFGRIVAAALSADPDSPSDDWIWLPPGFAHGTWGAEDYGLEYLCTGAWSPGCEVSISPHSPEIDWSVCDGDLAEEVRAALALGASMSGKDRVGDRLGEWAGGPTASHFIWAPGEPFDVADRLP